MKSKWIKFSPKEGLELVLEDYFEQGLRLIDVYFDRQEKCCLLVDANGLLDTEGHDHYLRQIIDENPGRYVRLPQSYPSRELQLMEEFVYEHDCPILSPSGFRNSISEFYDKVRKLGLESEWLNFRENYYLIKFRCWADRNDIDIKDFM